MQQNVNLSVIYKKPQVLLAVGSADTLHSSVYLITPGFGYKLWAQQAGTSLVR